MQFWLCVGVLHAAGIRAAVIRCLVCREKTRRVRSVDHNLMFGRGGIALPLAAFLARDAAAGSTPDPALYMPSDHSAQDEMIFERECVRASAGQRATRSSSSFGAAPPQTSPIRLCC